MSTEDNFEVQEVRGDISGPTLAVLAGVHGNETCGIEAFSLIPAIRLVKGRVIFVKANIAAIERKARFIETDLNRMFSAFPDTLEGRTAKRLRKILDRSDAMLDIHASFCRDSQPFIICESHSLDVAGYLPAEIVLTNIDRFHSGSTDYYMNTQGKVGICLECGFYADPGAVEAAMEGIISFLAAYGMIRKRIRARKQVVLTAKKLFVNHSDSFALARNFRDVERIPSRTLVGTEGRRNVFEEKGYIFFAKANKETGKECYLLAE